MVKINRHVFTAQSLTKNNSMSEQEKLRYVFDQIVWNAEKMKGSIRTACDFYHLSYGEKIKYMNTVIISAYIVSGMPEPYTELCMKFTHEFFLNFQN